MQNINRLSVKLFFLLTFLTISLHAGLYDDKYTSVNTSFANGSFEEIIRFEAINFSGKNMEEDSEKVLEKALEKIKSYVESGKDIAVTITGHTESITDDANEETVASKAYPRYVEELFYRSFDKKESKQIASDYALNVEKIMIDNNISKEILVVESKSGNNLAYDDSTNGADRLSNRVMVAIYVAQAPDTDIDGIFDSKDECPQTPRGVLVDKVGCALDSDKDGVADYKDICVNTPNTLQVDFQGCRLNDTLALVFKTDSDEILPVSDVIIQEFAKFMLDNEGYKAEIVGHTDSRNSEAYNMDLSQRRAESTKKALAEKGIDESRLTTRGEGELDPVATNETKVGRQKNRRIEVRIFYKNLK